MAGNCRWDAGGTDQSPSQSADRQKPSRPRPQRKLTADQAEAIRADTRFLKVIAKEYGVSEATVSLIRNGKGWRHL
jgi:hypothetical protein